MTDAETLARRCDPHVWELEPPDVSSKAHRAMSLMRARVRLGEVWWNPDTEKYEHVGSQPATKAEDAA